MTITLKSAADIEGMRVAGRLASEVLDMLTPHVKPGITTDDIDAYVHELTIKEGGYPSPLNYRGFPKSVCTSVNEVICHGIPDDRPLRDGDIINLDVTIFLDGVHGDTNATYFAGTADEESQQLLMRVLDLDTRPVPELNRMDPTLVRAMAAKLDKHRLTEIKLAVMEYYAAVIEQFPGSALDRTAERNNLMRLLR